MASSVMTWKRRKAGREKRLAEGGGWPSEPLPLAGNPGSAVVLSNPAAPSLISRVTADLSLWQLLVGGGRSAFHWRPETLKSWLERVCPPN